MKKIINFILLSFRYILFLGSFAITFFIFVTTNKQSNNNINSSIVIFIPYMVLLILFFINIIGRQKKVNSNIFYNLTCCLVFFTNMIVGYRAIYDKNMILNKIMGYDINMIYFNNYVIFMKLLMYGLCIGNICFMATKREQKEIISNKKEIEVL